MRTLKTMLLEAPALELHEADLLAELPSLSDWVPVTTTRLTAEVLGELPALAGLQALQA
ncbi:MAG: hypothetical protein ACK46X_10310 [Candidatus Sericytochromatia bacterium]